MNKYHRENLGTHCFSFNLIAPLSRRDKIGGEDDKSCKKNVAPIPRSFRMNAITRVIANPQNHPSPFWTNTTPRVKRKASLVQTPFAGTSALVFDEGNPSCELLSEEVYRWRNRIAPLLWTHLDESPPCRASESENSSSPFRQEIRSSLPWRGEFLLLSPFWTKTSSR